MGWRVLSCVFEGEELFCQKPEDFLLASQDKNQWRLFGGHRLWFAPEDRVLSYLSDNFPPEIRVEGEKLHLLAQGQKSQVSRGLELAFWECEGFPCVLLRHSFVNKSLWPLELAFWTITALKEGARGLIPLGQYRSHQESLNPKNHIVIWSYTNLQDERFTFHPEYVMVSQVKKDPQKIGSFVMEGWLAAEVGTTLFLKIFPVYDQHLYPDRGANAEIFTDNSLLELECLSPFLTIKSEETLYFPELWVFSKRSREGLYEQASEIFHKLRHHIPKVLV
ncbi:MAG: hypothetical protein NZM25_01365 [Leptospiraceae bacterium]|nr:hypothetical protein [Leptospiraceae bacterium]MDW8306374.1 hypothetical protein [Leptospiraceae bacterium]